MIIETQDDVTRAVLAEMQRTPDPRTKEILSAFVRHLHAFVKEVRMTEKEFQAAIGYLNAVGQKTTPSHNEAMLIAGALGVSNLVCLMNNGLKGTRPLDQILAARFGHAVTARGQHVRKRLDR